jgi:hypothetical protein
VVTVRNANGFGTAATNWLRSGEAERRVERSERANIFLLEKWSDRKRNVGTGIEEVKIGWGVAEVEAVRR